MGWKDRWCSIEAAPACNPGTNKKPHASMRLAVSQAALDEIARATWRAFAAGTIDEANSLVSIKCRCR